MNNAQVIIVSQKAIDMSRTSVKVGANHPV
jgi:hypothetical protein